jgi:serine/threonine-protein kinase
MKHGDEIYIDQVLNNRFKVESKIGEGGFGAVYRGVQLATGRKVALKLLHPEMTKDENLVARFRREGMVLCNLRDAHTITTYDFDQTPDGTLYIAMELLEGKSLHQIFHEQAPLEWKRVFKILTEMCSSLAEAHAQGIVHRDLKPENIYLESRPGNPEFVKILDFGIAKVMRGDSIDPQSPQLTATGQTLGTLEYMSPEQLMGKQLDAAATVGVESQGEPAAGRGSRDPEVPREGQEQPLCRCLRAVVRVDRGGDAHEQRAAGAVDAAGRGVELRSPRGPRAPRDAPRGHAEPAAAADAAAAAAAQHVGAAGDVAAQSGDVGPHAAAPAADGLDGRPEQPGLSADADGVDRQRSLALAGVSTGVGQPAPEPRPDHADGAAVVAVAVVGHRLARARRGGRCGARARDALIDRLASEQRARALLALRIIGPAVEPRFERGARTRCIAARLRDRRFELERFGEGRCARTRTRTRFGCALGITGGEQAARRSQIAARRDERRQAIRIERRVPRDIR